MADNLAGTRENRQKKLPFNTMAAVRTTPRLPKRSPGLNLVDVDGLTKPEDRRKACIPVLYSVMLPPTN